MRIVLIGAEPTGLGAQLAAHLGLPLYRKIDQITADIFVLDGGPRDVNEARALDATLSSRGAEVDAVVVVEGGLLAREAVVEHYLGKVVELENGSLEAVLERLRESMLAA